MFGGMAMERAKGPLSAEDEAMLLAKTLGGHVEILIEDVDGTRIYTVTITSRDGLDLLGVGGSFEDAAGHAVQNYAKFD